MPDDRADPTPSAADTPGRGLSLAPFRARRYADVDRLSQLLSPPYDVIGDEARAELLERDDQNVVRLILPRTTDRSDPYLAARDSLDRWSRSTTGPVLALDPDPALYVYEMRSTHGTTRGIVGAVELRDPVDGVILPHENVMAGPVADRLALMDATDANLEPIYLVYPGGGATSAVVAGVDDIAPLATTTTPDGVTHTLWAITDPGTHAAVADDLAGHRAVIADGHHRYATYRELQARRRVDGGAGPWDRGLTLLVDTSIYGAQVEPIHRVLPGVGLDDALARLAADTHVPPVRVGSAMDVAAALDQLHAATGPTATVVLAAGDRAYLVEGLAAPGEELGHDLDVVAVHRDLIERRLGIADTVETVRYAHDVAESIALAARADGVAVLLRATPVDAVMAVAQAGGRMPRKSTLFVPKPASGMFLRRFADQ